MHGVSSDDYYTEINLENQQSLQYDIVEFKPVIYAACVCDNKWYIGNILEVWKEFGYAFVDFMKIEGKSFRWPSKKDQCWIQSNLNFHYNISGILSWCT